MPQLADPYVIGDVRTASPVARSTLRAGFVASLWSKSRATEPMLSRDSDWVLQLKISRTRCPWAVWSVGFCGVHFAIYSPRRARGTAKPECFDMFRVADRPATYAGSKLHKFNPNRRGERPRFIETLPIDHELRCSLLITAEPAVGCWSFDRAADFGHFAFATFSFRVISALASDQSTVATFLFPHGYNPWTTRLRASSAG